MGLWNERMNDSVAVLKTQVTLTGYLGDMDVLGDNEMMSSYMKSQLEYF